MKNKVLLVFIFLIIVLLFITIQSRNNQSKSSENPTLQEETSETIPEESSENNNDISINEFNTAATDFSEDQEAQEIRNEFLEGRGHSDSGRSEPSYVNNIGYVVVSYSEQDLLARTDSFKEIPWTIPIQEKNEQSNTENNLIEHKTEVKIISQQLEHEGYGSYSGYLLAERLDTKEQFYIDVSNFITKPYWTYDDLEKAASVGYYIAEYSQISNHYPVDRSNQKVELDNGTIVLVTGTTGLYGSNGPDSNINELEAIVFKEWKYGYGGVSVFFNKQDLTIIY